MYYELSVFVWAEYLKQDGNLIGNMRTEKGIWPAGSDVEASLCIYSSDSSTQWQASDNGTILMYIAWHIESDQENETGTAFLLARAAISAHAPMRLEMHRCVGVHACNIFSVINHGTELFSSGIAQCLKPIADMDD